MENAFIGRLHGVTDLRTRQAGENEYHKIHQGSIPCCNSFESSQMQEEIQLFKVAGEEEEAGEAQIFRWGFES